eukprot:scaffold39008_cov37-Prasinocladus_malaysianus.AAC.3
MRRVVRTVDSAYIVSYRVCGLRVLRIRTGTSRWAKTRNLRTNLLAIPEREASNIPVTKSRLKHFIPVALAISGIGA